MKKYLAEMVGTMVLVLLGCGSAVFNFGCGTTAQVLTVAMAFGLSVVAMAYTIGGISGCHINPAITLGVYLSKRMSGKDAHVHAVSSNRRIYRFGHNIWHSVGHRCRTSSLHSPKRQFCNYNRLQHVSTGRVLDCRLDCRNSLYCYICACSAWHYRQQEGRRQFCRARDRSVLDSYPHRVHPVDRHVGQSGTLDCPGRIRRR